MQALLYACSESFWFGSMLHFNSKTRIHRLRCARWLKLSEQFRCAKQSSMSVGIKVESRSFVRANETCWYFSFLPKFHPYSRAMGSKIRHNKLLYFYDIDRSHLTQKRKLKSSRRRLFQEPIDPSLRSLQTAFVWEHTCTKNKAIEDTTCRKFTEKFAVL